MTVTSSGVVCDVCGKLVLLDTMHRFEVEGISQALHCHHTTCKATLDACEKDWHLLPEGPLRKAFNEAFEDE